MRHEIACVLCAGALCTNGVHADGRFVPPEVELTRAARWDRAIDTAYWIGTAADAYTTYDVLGKGGSEHNPLYSWADNDAENVVASMLVVKAVAYFALRRARRSGGWRRPLANALLAGGALNSVRATDHNLHVIDKLDREADAARGTIRDRTRQP